MNKKQKYLEIINRKPNKTDRKILQIITDLEKIADNNDVIIIAIDGKSGSGKTTLSKILSELFDANHYHVDDFFQKPFIKSDDLLSQYGSNIDFTKIIETVIAPIKEKQDVSYQPFDFATHKHLDDITIKHKRINIIEGSYSMHPYLEKNYQYKIFMKINWFKQAFRIIRRSGIKRFWRFVRVWIPNENKYNKALKIAEKANVVI